MSTTTTKAAMLICFDKYWEELWDHNYHKLSLYDGLDVRENTFNRQTGDEPELYNWWRSQIGLRKGRKATDGRRKKMLEDIGVDFNLTRVRRVLEEKAEDHFSGIDRMREHPVGMLILPL